MQNTPIWLRSEETLNSQAIRVFKRCTDVLQGFELTEVFSENLEAISQKKKNSLTEKTAICNVCAIGEREAFHNKFYNMSILF